MKSHPASLLLIGILSVSLASCNLGPVSISFGPTATPTATPTPVPTATPTATPTPVLISGIDFPVNVRGVDLVFDKVELLTEFQTVFGTSGPKPPYTHLLKVTAKTTNSVPNTPCTWRGDDTVSLSWTRDGTPDKITWGICMSNPSDGTVDFLFAGYANLKDLVIHLPDGVDVPIQPLLK